MTDFTSKRWGLTTEISTTNFEDMTDNDKKLNEEHSLYSRGFMMRTLGAVNTTFTTNYFVIGENYSWKNVANMNLPLKIKVEGQPNEFICVGCNVPAIHVLDNYGAHMSDENALIEFRTKIDTPEGPTISSPGAMISPGYMCKFLGAGYCSISFKSVYKVPEADAPYVLEIDVWGGVAPKSALFYPANWPSQIQINGEPFGESQFWVMHAGIIP